MPCDFCLLSFFLSSPNLSSRRLDVYHTSTHGLSANLECRSERCCMRLAANAGPKKCRQNRHLSTIPQLCRAISSQLRTIDNRKKLLSSNMSSRCPHNMVNFGLLTAEIVSGVWGTPTNFNGLLRLGSVTALYLVVGVRQTLRR